MMEDFGLRWFCDFQPLCMCSAFRYLSSMVRTVAAEREKWELKAICQRPDPALVPPKVFEGVLKVAFNRLSGAPLQTLTQRRPSAFFQFIRTDIRRPLQRWCQREINDWSPTGSPPPKYSLSPTSWRGISGRCSAGCRSSGAQQIMTVLWCALDKKQDAYSTASERRLPAPSHVAVTRNTGKESVGTYGFPLRSNHQTLSGWRRHRWCAVG